MFLFTLASTIGQSGVDMTSLSLVDSVRVAGVAALLELLACLGIKVSGVGPEGPGLTETLAPAGKHRAE